MVHKTFTKNLLTFVASYAIIITQAKRKEVLKNEHNHLLGYCYYLQRCSFGTLLDSQR